MHPTVYLGEAQAQRLLEVSLLAPARKQPAKLRSALASQNPFAHS